MIGELEQHINVSDSKKFLNEIREKGLTGQTLHPLGDLNPFTHELEAEDNPESVLRRAKTRTIVATADVEPKQEMADAVRVFGHIHVWRHRGSRVTVTLSPCPRDILQSACVFRVC